MQYIHNMVRPGEQSYVRWFFNHTSTSRRATYGACGHLVPPERTTPLPSTGLLIIISYSLAVATEILSCSVADSLMQMVMNDWERRGDMRELEHMLGWNWRVDNLICAELTVEPLCAMRMQ